MYLRSKNKIDRKNYIVIDFKNKTNKKDEDSFVWTKLNKIPTLYIGISLIIAILITLCACIHTIRYNIYNFKT